MAVGMDSASDNVILTSPDGITWTPYGSPIGTGGLRAVAYGGGYFVAVGAGGVIRYSSDGGTNWNPGISGTFVNLNAITYGNSEFAAAGDSSSILISPNGSSWAASAVNPTGGSFSGIAYGNSTFVAVEDFSGFYYSTTSAGTTFNLATTITPFRKQFLWRFCHICPKRVCRGEY